MRALALSAIAVALSIGGCKARPETSAVTPIDPAAKLREEARVVLEKHCGQCHFGTYETALPRALAVFDLSDEQWNAKLTEAQLHSARGRIESDLGPDGEKREVPDEDRAIIRRFVAAEIARLATHSREPQAASRADKATDGPSRFSE
jgi:hypothetical protein